MVDCLVGTIAWIYKYSTLGTFAVMRARMWWFFGMAQVAAHHVVHAELMPVGVNLTIRVPCFDCRVSGICVSLRKPKSRAGLNHQFVAKRFVAW